MAGGKVPLTFRLFKGEELLREEKLTLPVIKVGKLSSSHLRLDDKNVSRMHALIEVTGPGDVSIIDLSSTTGTFVNGQKVNKAKLQSGDSIVIGETRIEVTIGGAEEDDDLPTKVQASPSGPVGDAGVIASTPRPPVPAAASAPTMMGAPAAPPPPAAPTFAPPAPSIPSPMAPRAPAPRPVAAANIPAPFGMQQPVNTGFSPLSEQVEEPGARAVEVAAMLGNSVVSVKHVMNPRGGKVSSTTQVFFALSALFLIVGLVGFGAGYYNASFNEAKKHQWVEVDKKPSWAYRPKKLGVANDVMVFLGFPLGIAFLASGLLRLRDEKNGNPWFRIGQNEQNEFPTTEAPADSFPLIAPRGDDFVFNYAQGMEGEMQVDGQSISLADLQAQGRATPSSTAPGGLEVAIPQKARIRVKSGNATFLVTSVPQPKRHPVPLFATLEAAVLLFFAGSAIAHFGFVFLLWTVPPDQDTALTDMAVNEDTSNKAQTTSQEDPPPPEQEDEDDGEDESGGTGTAMMLEEGKMGKKDSDRAEGQYKMKKNADQEQLARQQAIEQARTAGVLGSAALSQGGNFASITGTGDISSGFDDIDIVTCTHLHVDHVGWNTRLENGRWVPTFKNARYLMSRTELDHWTQRERKDASTCPWITDSVLPVVAASKADLVTSRHVVNDHIHFIPTPGHTIDHFSVRIGKKGQDAVLTGDMIHSPIQARYPEVGMMSDYDSAQAGQSRRELFGSLCDTSTLVCTGHFPSPSTGRVSRWGDGFRIA